MAEVTVEVIDAILDSEGTKADKARRLYALSEDITRNDVVELLGMNYSQAHSIWKSRGNATQPRISRLSAKGMESTLRKAKNRSMRFSPTQTRYVTQGDHEIYRVDDPSGQPICRRCLEPLTFSIEVLAFVHTFSKEPVTDIVDHYHDSPEEAEPNG